MKQLCSILLIALSLLSCGGRMDRLLGSGDSVSFKYATLPSIVEYDGYTVVNIENPWKDGKALHTYVLVPKDAKAPSSVRLCRKRWCSQRYTAHY